MEEQEENKDRHANGRFKKGNSFGRPKGSRSERSLYWEEMGDWFANEGLDQYTANLEQMLKSGNVQQKAEGMKRFEALLEYFKPKLQRTESNVKHEGAVPITINKTYKQD